MAYSSRSHIVDVPDPACALHKYVIAPFLNLRRAAMADGFDLVAQSSFRDFSRQLAIWNGKFSGEIISTDTLIVGEGAEVKANVQVGSLVCLGDFNGDAKATKSIELKAPAKVHGNLTTASILIERGVFFDGTCKMDTTGTHSAPPSHMSTQPKK